MAQTVSNGRLDTSGGGSAGARLPLAYLGGVRAVRMLTTSVVAVSVLLSALLLWTLVETHEPAIATSLVALQLATVAIAVLVRLRALRTVVVTQDAWLLVPLLGKPQRMPRAADAYESGEDVIAVGIDGRTTVLGVDRFPFRRPRETRLALIESLRFTPPSSVVPLACADRARLH